MTSSTGIESTGAARRVPLHRDCQNRARRTAGRVPRPSRASYSAAPRYRRALLPREGEPEPTSATRPEVTQAYMEGGRPGELAESAKTLSSTAVERGKTARPLRGSEPRGFPRPRAHLQTGPLYLPAAISRRSVPFQLLRLATASSMTTSRARHAQASPRHAVRYTARARPVRPPSRARHSAPTTENARGRFANSSAGASISQPARSRPTGCFSDSSEAVQRARPPYRLRASCASARCLPMRPRTLPNWISRPRSSSGSGPGSGRGSD